MAELEPGIAEFVRRVQRMVETMPPPKTIEERREFRERMSAAMPVPTPGGWQIRDRFLHAPGRIVPVRVYERHDAPPGQGVVLFFHGGGFVSGSVHTHDVYALGLAEAADLPVVSVNYRLAPENPYPAGLEDCYFALNWLAGHGAAQGWDPARIAIGGDSAGGTLAAACALMAADRGEPALRMLYLIFPALDTRFDEGSMVGNRSDPFLSREDLIYYWDAYLQGHLDSDDPYAVPARALRLHGLPPTFVLTAEHDPLRDEAEQFGRRLREAGVPTEVRRAPGAIHGFLRARLVSRLAEEETLRLGQALREALMGRPAAKLRPAGVS
jgi:acetyl esterase